MLFQGCTVARSWMKRITSHNRHNTQISNHLWPQPGNLQPSCAVDFCAGSRRGKLNLASVVEMEGDESGGAPAKKKKIGWLMKVLMTCRCVWLILRWRSVWVRMSLADLWQYPLLHGPLLRAEHPDTVVVYLFLRGAGQSGWVEWNSSRSVGSRMSFLGTQDHSSGPYPFSSPLGIPADHHVAGSPRFSWPYRWRRPPESKEEGVPLLGQALWRENQESGMAWVMKHGRKDEFCIEEGVVSGRWPGWFVWWWWRANVSGTSCRAGAYGCLLLTARPSVQVGN